VRILSRSSIPGIKRDNIVTCNIKMYLTSAASEQYTLGMIYESNESRHPTCCTPVVECEASVSARKNGSDGIENHESHHLFESEVLSPSKILLLRDQKWIVLRPTASPSASPIIRTTDPALPVLGFFQLFSCSRSCILYTSQIPLKHALP